MYYGFGRGFGFRGAAPPYPYVGRGRGGFPRCWYPGVWATPPAYGGYPAYSGYPTWEAMPYPPRMTPEQELGFLKEEANAVKSQLEEIEARIHDLENKEE